ncbi:MAG TPA: gliding motility-associated C-terminal domain-containing protein, partial [Chitinophagales bacterium]|nr:gliding motility-associated C-terminal domain-containing protein [Chitinophagales bacterium]
NVDNGNVYSWGPATGNINCNSCATTNATPTQETIYTIQVMDTNGCRASDTVTVSVNSITDIFIPNAFSPNNDGNNDVFQLFGDVGTISFLDMKVFNRWGELVFESSKHNFEWDGTYKGETVPQGTYIYVAKIAFVNGYVRNDLKGSLTVIR